MPEFCEGQVAGDLAVQTGEIPESIGRLDHFQSEASFGALRFEIGGEADLQSAPEPGLKKLARRFGVGLGQLPIELDVRSQP